MNLSITPATPDDIPAIVTLLDEIDQYYGATEAEDPADRRSFVQRLVLGDRPAAHVLLARHDSEVVGLASYSYLWPAKGATHSLFLKELYVRAASRRCGVGRALMDRLFDIAAAAGCTRIEWAADLGNDTALNFYKHLGVAAEENKVLYRVERTDQTSAAHNPDHPATWQGEPPRQM